MFPSLDFEDFFKRPADVVRFSFRESIYRLAWYPAAAIAGAPAIIDEPLNVALEGGIQKLGDCRRSVDVGLFRYADQILGNLGFGQVRVGFQGN